MITIQSSAPVQNPVIQSVRLDSLSCGTFIQLLGAYEKRQQSTDATQFKRAQSQWVAGLVVGPKNGQIEFVRVEGGRLQAPMTLEGDVQVLPLKSEIQLTAQLV